MFEELLFEKIDAYWLIVSWIMGIIVGYGWGYVKGVEKDE